MSGIFNRCCMCCFGHGSQNGSAQQKWDRFRLVPWKFVSSIVLIVVSSVLVETVVQDIAPYYRANDAHWRSLLNPPTTEDSSWSRAKLNGQEVYIGSMSSFLDSIAHAHSAYYGLQFDSLDAYYHVPLPSSSRKHRQAASAGVSASDAKLEQRLNKKQEQGRDEGKRYRTTLELESEFEPLVIEGHYWRSKSAIDAPSPSTAARILAPFRFEMTPAVPLGPFTTPLPYTPGLKEPPAAYDTAPTDDKAVDNENTEAHRGAKLCSSVEELWDPLQLAAVAVKREKEESEEDQRIDQWIDDSTATAKAPRRPCLLKGRSQLQEFVRSIDSMHMKFRVRNFELMHRTGKRACHEWHISLVYSFTHRAHMSLSVRSNAQLCPGISPPAEFYHLYWCLLLASLWLLALTLRDIVSSIKVYHLFRAFNIHGTPEKAAAAAMHEKHHRGHAHFSANSVNFAISQTAKLGGRDGSESTSLLGTSGSHTRRHSDYNSLRHAQGRNSAKWAVGPSDKGAGKAAVPDDYAYQHRAVLTRIRSHKSAAAAAAGRVAGRVGEGGAAREVQNLWGIMTFSEKLSVFNLWFFVTVLATCCNIAYSFLALTSDGSVYLRGVGCFFSWVGLLEFFEGTPALYVVITTLRLGLFKVVLFLLGVSPLFVGYAYLGVVLFSSVSSYFANVSCTMVTLFCLLNGDNMQDTFNELWVVLPVWSRIYLYTFITLFICAVLNIFIAIITDSYQISQSFQTSNAPERADSRRSSVGDAEHLKNCETCLPRESLQAFARYVAVAKEAHKSLGSSLHGSSVGNASLGESGNGSGGDKGKHGSLHTHAHTHLSTLPAAPSALRRRKAAEASFESSTSNEKERNTVHCDGGAFVAFETPPPAVSVPLYQSQDADSEGGKGGKGGMVVDIEEQQHGKQQGADRVALSTPNRTYTSTWWSDE